MVPRCEAKSRSDIETDEKISIKKLKNYPIKFTCVSINKTRPLQTERSPHIFTQNCNFLVLNCIKHVYFKLISVMLGSFLKFPSIKVAIEVTEFMAEYLRGRGSKTQGSKTSQIRIKNNKQ